MMPKLKQLVTVAAVVTVLALNVAGATEEGPPRRAMDDAQMNRDRPFNSEYLFAVTRDARDSGGSPAMVACLAPLTLVVDLFLLPIEAVLGVLG